MLETDNASVAMKLSDETRDRSVLGPLIEDLKTAPREFVQCEVKAMWCMGISVAHKLAKEGCDNKLCKTWFKVAPDFVSDLS